MDQDDAVLVRVLAEQKRLGNSSDNGFKKPVWIAVATALAVESPKNDPPKIWNKCQDHWGNVSNLYSIFTAHI